MDGLTRALVESAVAVLKPSGPVLEIGAGVGAALFGKRYFRSIRHWSDLVIRTGDPHAGD